MVDDPPRQYEGDIIYEVWRAGGSPDAVSPDRLDDYWWDHPTVEEAVEAELRLQASWRCDGGEGKGVRV